MKKNYRMARTLRYEKEKEGIVVVKIPKGTMLKDVLIQTDSIHTNN